MGDTGSVLKDVPHGANLGEVLFEFRGEPQGPDFPVKMVSPDELERMGVGRECVWALNQLSEDFNRPPSVCFEVWLNSRTDGKIQRLMDDSPRGRTLSRMLMVEIASEACRVVFQSGQPADTDDGLVQILYEKLAPNGELTLEELQRRANDPSSESLNRLAQNTEGLASFFASVDVRKGT